MSVTSMNSRMAMAEKLSVPQLQQAIQSGSIPAYIGVPMLEQRMKEQKQAQSMTQQAPQRAPIAQEVMDQAQGIAAMPSNLPEAYANGGIIAFVEGGDVDDEDHEDERDQAEYQQLLQQYLAETEESGIQGLNRTKRVNVVRKADGGIIAFAEPTTENNNSLVTDPDKDPRIIALRQDPSYLAFADNGGNNGDTSLTAFLQAGNTPTPLRQTSDPKQLAIDAYAPNNAGIYNRQPGVPIAEAFSTYAAKIGQKARGDESNVPNDLRPYSDKGMFSNIPLGGPNSKPPTASSETSSNDYSMNAQEGTGRLAGDMNAAPSTAGITPLVNRGAVPAGRETGGGTRATGFGATSGDTSSNTQRPRSTFDDFLDSIKSSRDDLAKQKQEDKYMALVSAGLGMMGGSSPNALQNIGQGAQAGVASFMASGKQRAAEKAALDKSMLMGQRYQSMEDIAGRTADINEARYQAIAAARAAGDGGLKAEAALDKEEASLTRRIQQGQNTVAAALKARFGDNGAMLYPDKFNEAYAQLMKQYVEPTLLKQDRLNQQRYPDLFAPTTQQPPTPTNRAPLSSFQTK